MEKFKIYIFIYLYKYILKITIKKKNIYLGFKLNIIKINYSFIFLN